MNCRRFQKRLHEYVEGSLSPEARARSLEHLAQCSACREALRMEQAFGRAVGEGLHQATQTLTLDPAVQQRVLATLARERGTGRQAVSWLPQRLAWQFGLAACLLLAWCLATLYFTGILHPGSKTASTRRNMNRVPLRIRVSYPVQAHIFRLEGNRVIDTWTSETNFVEQTLWVENRNRKPMGITPERKTTL